jgi:hypothetical protein
MLYMNPIDTSDAYVKSLKERAKQSRAYTAHQLAGLELAEMLHDPKHKSLYIKLAKEHGTARLFELAKSVLEKSDIENPGAYFMSLTKGLKKQR